MADVLEFDIVNVIGDSVDADGFPSTQHDADGEEVAGVPAVETHHWLGVWARPLAGVQDKATGQVDPGNSAKMLHAYESAQAHAWLMEDPREIANLPNLQPGERLFYSAFGNFLRLAKDGSCSLSTTDKGGDPSGQSIAYRLASDGVQEFGPWGQRRFDQYGYRIRTAGGARFTLGTAGGLLPGLSSSARLQADIVEINGTAVHIGPTGAPCQPVAMAAPTVAVFTAIGVALASIQAALASIPTGGSAAGAACGPAVELAVADIASALVTISTQTAIA